MVPGDGANPPLPPRPTTTEADCDPRWAAGNEHRRFRALLFGGQVGIQLRIGVFRHRHAVAGISNEAGKFGIGDRCHIDRKCLHINGRTGDSSG